MKGVIAKILVLSVLVSLFMVSMPQSAAAADVPVTVTITRFIQIDDPDPAPGQGVGDFYPRVTINGFGAETRSEIEATDISPFWTFTKTVDTAVVGNSILVTIEIRDADSGIAAPDDEIDLSVVDNKNELDLILDLTTGNWTSSDPGFAMNQTFSQGDGDTEHSGIFEGGERGKVFFDISILSNTGDADGDGLLDGWETKGLDANGDGSIDVDLPGFGADPNHKDLFLEFDWVNAPTNQAPTQVAIQTLKAAFAAAPINAGSTPNNPDGLPGINLWVDTGSLTDPTASEDGAGANTCGDTIDNGGGDGADAADPDCLVGDNLGGGNGVGGAPGCLDLPFYAVKAGNFDANRRWVFRYGISGDPANNNPCNGGRGEIGGNDFIEFNHDAGTIMHEFGHNLNLHHGGNVDNNCKPNYVSVMNYDNQFGINQAGGANAIIDYSPPRFPGGRGAAPINNLTENGLNEAVILDGTDATNRFVFVDGTGTKIQSALNQPVDWDGNGNTTGSGLSVNIDTSGTNGRPSACTNGSSNSTLGGHHDWNVIALNFRPFGDSADGAINPTGVEPTLQELLELQEELNTADLELTKSDSSDPAIAGDQLVYMLTVTNHGPNPSSDTIITDILPAGVSYVSDDAGCVEGPAGTITCDVGEILDGASAVVNLTVLIDANLVHVAGTPVTITNSASVENLAGPDPDETNNDASEDTLVVAVADLEIVSFEAVNPPGQMLVGDDVDITLRKIITNNGLSAPMDTNLTRSATAPPDSTVIPSAPADREELALAFGEMREVIEVFTIHCSQPSPHIFTFNNEIQPLRTYPALPDDSDPLQANNTAQVVLQIECVVPVAINIHPGSFPNSINPGEEGVIPVAVLTTEAGEYGLPLAFDAATIDPLSVRFDRADGLEGAYAAAEFHNQGHLEKSIEKLLDSKGREKTKDQDLDMVLHFDTPDTSIDSNTTEACVKGEWVDSNGGVHKFFGCDSVNTVPH